MRIWLDKCAEDGFEVRYKDLEARSQESRTNSEEPERQQQQQRQPFAALPLKRQQMWLKAKRRRKQKRQKRQKRRVNTDLSQNSSLARREFIRKCTVDFTNGETRISVKLKRIESRVGG